MPRRTFSELFENPLLYQVILIMAGMLEGKVALKWYGMAAPKWGMGALVVSGQRTEDRDQRSVVSSQ